jgi:hypothetical protein
MDASWNVSHRFKTRNLYKEQSSKYRSTASVPFAHKFKSYYSPYPQNNIVLVATEIRRLFLPWISKTNFDTNVTHSFQLKLIFSMWANWCLLRRHDRSIGCRVLVLAAFRKAVFVYEAQRSIIPRYSLEIRNSCNCNSSKRLAWYSNTANNRPVNVTTVVIWLITSWRLSFDCSYQHFKRI